MGVFKKFGCAAALTLGLSMLGVVDVNAAPNPNFHIYIAYGQSNMAGNGEIVPSVDQATNPKNFLMLASHTANASSRKGSTTQSIKMGEWYPAIPPMFHAFEQLSPADYFGRAMVDSLPGVTVGIIPVAIGAVSIRAFDKDQYESYFKGDGKDIMSWGWPKDYDNNPPGRILELAKKAMQVGVIKGFIFHQGESDGVDDNWRRTVYKTYKDVIDALGLNENDVPFVAGEMLQESGACCGSKNAGIALLKNNFKKFGLASSKGLKGNGKDPYHFGREGVIELGKRYASEMLKLIDKTIDPNAPPVDLVNPENSVVPDEPPEEYGPYVDVIEIPGKIQAENYNKGGAEVAYHDNNKGNEGGILRKDDVDIYQPNMGMVVGYCEKGDWMKYSVKVEEDGEYEISALVAGDNGTGSFALYIDDEKIGEDIVNEGKGFGEFTTVSGGKATLKAGEHELKLEITNSWIDIDYVEFKKVMEQSGENTVDPAVIRIGAMNSGKVDMSKAQYFDMQGNRISKSATRNLGVYLVRVPGGKTLVKRTEK